jgi:hypothetical protein
MKADFGRRVEALPSASDVKEDLSRRYDAAMAPPPPPPPAAAAGPSPPARITPTSALAVSAPLSSRTEI